MLGNSRNDHIRKGHKIHPRYEVVTRNGRQAWKIKRWVCDCGRTFRA